MSLAELDDSRLVIIIGRGHSGTRAIASLVTKAGVKLGEPQNGSLDYMPKPNGMYEVARLAGARVNVGLGLSFDFSRLVEEPIPARASEALERFVRPVLNAAGWVGWKLPESTLAYPWLVRLFPRARFIWWLRDPRDCILRNHGTDDLAEWGVQGCSEGTARQQRARSWLYQEAIVRCTPKPRYLLRLTFDQWASQQPGVMRLLGEFLPGSKPGAIPVERGAVNRWQKEDHEYDAHTLTMLAPAIERYGWLPS